MPCVSCGEGQQELCPVRNKYCCRFNSLDMSCTGPSGPAGQSSVANMRACLLQHPCHVAVGFVGHQPRRLDNPTIQCTSFTARRAAVLGLADHTDCIQALSGSNIFYSPACSLEVPPSKDEQEMSQSVGSNSPLRRVLWLLGYHSSEAVNIRAATRLYDAVCEQADTDGLHDATGMIPVFYSRWCALLPGAAQHAGCQATLRWRATRPDSRMRCNAP
jgi:hypothetical protein